MLAVSLDLPQSFFHPYFTHPVAFLRPLHYAPTVSQPESGVLGAGAHTDYGCFTFLLMGVLMCDCV